MSVVSYILKHQPSALLVVNERSNVCCCCYNIAF